MREEDAVEVPTNDGNAAEVMPEGIAAVQAENAVTAGQVRDEVTSAVQAENNAVTAEQVRDKVASAVQAENAVAAGQVRDADAAAEQVLPVHPGDADNVPDADIKAIEMSGVVSKSKADEKQQSWKCKLCGKEGWTRDWMNEHNWWYHPELWRRKVWTYQRCTFSTTRENEAKEHGSRHHILVGWFVCDECDLMWVNLVSFREHKYQRQNKKSLNYKFRTLLTKGGGPKFSKKSEFHK